MAGAALAAQLCACSVPAGNVISGQGSLSYPEESEASLSEAEQSSKPEQSSEPEEVLQPKITLSSNEVQRGSFMIVRIENYDGKAVEYKDFLGYERSFFEYDGGWLSLIPVKTAAKAGNYVLTIILDGVRYDNDITVTERDFE